MTQKTTSIVLVVLAFFLITSCSDDTLIPLPDLNPSSPEGGEIVIIDISATYEFNGGESYYNPSFLNVTDEYDLNENGSVDLILESTFRTILGIDDLITLDIFMPEWQILAEPAFFPFETHTPLFLPPAVMEGASHVSAVWKSGNHGLKMFFEQTNFSSSLWYGFPSFPVDYSYVPIRKFITGEWYYGWLEIISTDYMDNNPEDGFIISKLGYSSTPGLRIGMGQE